MENTLNPKVELAGTEVETGVQSGGQIGEGVGRDVGEDVDEDLGGAGIDLDITGPDLMLSGRFQDWDSGVTMGPDLDQLNVRLAIDATSATTNPTTLVTGPALFSFRGRDAAPVGSGTYQVDGELTSPAGARPMQMVVETPIEHSPVFLLSFQARKSDIGPGWTRLLSNVVPFTRRSDDESPAMPAHAWLTVPVLAAA